MTRSRAVRLVAVSALVIAGLCVWTVFAYRRDIGRARERVTAGSRLAATPCGALEYAMAGGGGPAVLAVHGAGGGYDQGLDIAERLVRRGYRVVAVSRFGYLRAPLPADASPAAQADAYACLLDALRIPHAAVIGVSAGGPSSMQFALRHPDRVDALILLVPLAYPPRVRQRASPVMVWMFDRLLQSDFLFWLASRVAHDAVLQVVLGTPPEVVAGASADDRARAARMLEHILPVSPRRLGLFNDMAMVTTLTRYELERIRTPTLIVTTNDDGYGTYEGAQESAGRIPGARLFRYPSGGHLLIGHQEEILAESEKLLRPASR